MLMSSCKKDINPTIPVLTTTAVSNITLTTANCGGNITSDGGAAITARGVCWSTCETPTIADSKTTDGTGTGSFTSNITGLTAYTTYYARAYATNSAGTGYGSSLSILKLDCIYAGIYDTSFFYHEFPTPILLNIKMDSNMLVADALDTIQLQLNNSSYELLVLLKIINQDSSFVINQMGTFINSRLDLLSYDNMNFAITREEYYIGLGATTTFDFISAYSYNEVIMSNTKWSAQLYNGNDVWFSMWDNPVNPPMWPAGYNGGPWYVYGPSIRYIGFNYKGRLGWIKVDISDAYNPKFISYAIKK